MKKILSFGIQLSGNHPEMPLNPEKDVPSKPNPNPDPTKPKPGGNEPHRVDPTRIEEPSKNDPTRINEPPKPSPQPNPQPEPQP